MDIYRGQAGTGFGNAPDLMADGGDQYLWASADLWTAEIAKAARPWLTLDADELDRRQLEDNLEAWSYFSMPVQDRQISLVARLTTAGIFGGRNAYFAHGRAWFQKEFAGANDWGALLGRAEAFSQPWRDCPVPDYNSALRPEMVWQQLLRDKAEAAVGLVAALKEAVVSGRPVAMLAPLEDFKAGSSLHALVSFARAALPLEEKIRSRIRIYTSRPDVFLENQLADLIVIPEALRNNALRSTRRPSLIGRDGEIIHGKIDIEAVAYAKIVVKRATDLPDALFTFTERVGARVKPGDPPLAFYYSYNLAAAGTDMNGTVRSLFSKTPERNDPYPWERLISIEDWSACDLATLRDLALQFPTSADMRHFRDCVVWALRHLRKADVGQGLGAYLEKLGEDQFGEELLYFFGAGLAPPSAVVSGLSSLSSKKIWALIGDKAKAKVIAGLFDGESIPERWLDEFPKMPGFHPQEAFQRLLWLVGYCSDQAATPWRRALDVLVPKITSQRPVPRELVLGYCDLPRRGLNDTLDHAELLTRVGELPQAQEALRILKQTDDRANRRKVIKYAQDGTNFTSLRGFVPPPEWDVDVADFLLAGDEQSLRTIEFSRLVKLAANAESPPKVVYDIADQRAMQADMGKRREALAVVKRTGFWMAWRTHSRLNRQEFRNCGWAWLSDQHTSDLRLEEWTQVILDLGNIRGEEIEGHRPKWPTIELHEEQLRRDRAQACKHDLGALAALAESLDSRTPSYQQVVEDAGLPAEVSGWLYRLSTIPYTPLSLTEAVKLVNGTTHRKARALQAAREATLSEFTSHPKEARLCADNYGFWGEEEFLQRIRGMLDNGPSRYSENFLNQLNSALAGKSSRGRSREETARSYHNGGYHVIAEFLYPRFQGGRPPAVREDREEMLRGVVGRIRDMQNRATPRQLLETVEAFVPYCTSGEIGSVVGQFSLNEQGASTVEYWSDFFACFRDMCVRRGENFEHGLARVQRIVRGAPWFRTAFCPAFPNFSVVEAPAASS